MRRAKETGRLEMGAENEAEIKRSPIAPDCKRPSATLEYRLMLNRPQSSHANTALYV